MHSMMEFEDRRMILHSSCIPRVPLRQRLLFPIILVLMLVATCLVVDFGPDDRGGATIAVVALVLLLVWEMTWVEHCLTTGEIVTILRVFWVPALRWRTSLNDIKSIVVERHAGAPRRHPTYAIVVGLDNGARRRLWAGIIEKQAMEFAAELSSIKHLPVVPWEHTIR